MKKAIFILAGCLLAGASLAQTTDESQYPILNEDDDFIYNEQSMEPLDPTYLENVTSSSVWGSNWFLSVKGGISAFTGKPQGCGDLFNRIKPMLNISVGKWFTPYFGARLAFQGLKFKDAFLETQSYQNLHVDILYNVSSHMRHCFDPMPKWDLAIYAGTGIIRNPSKMENPFAISYGITASYRLTNRLQLMGELGGTTTRQSFDGNTTSNHLGDHLLQASIGLTVTIGNVGFKKVVDAKPYIYQNDVLMEYIGHLSKEKSKLLKEKRKDAMALQEMRKILEIEGLLDKYNLAVPEGEPMRAHPKNNYSGLNSLRTRLRSKNLSGSEDEVMTELASNFGDGETDSIMRPEQYFKMMKDGRIFVGSPVFFFFKVATDQLTERAQIINIKEVASTIRRFGLSVRIVGAADSQTGTAYGNERLSAKRADYISKLLQENGVPEDRISMQYQGGISTYVPQEGNRNTCIMLYYK